MRWSLSTKITLAFLVAILLFVGSTLLQVRAVRSLRSELGLYRGIFAVQEGAVRLERELRTLSDLLGRGDGVDLRWTRTQLDVFRVHEHTGRLATMLSRLQRRESFPDELRGAADALRLRLGQLERGGDLARRIAADPATRSALAPLDPVAMGSDAMVQPLVVRMLLVAHDGGERERVRVLATLLRQHLMQSARGVATFKAGIGELKHRMEEILDARRTRRLQLVLGLLIGSLVVAVLLLVAVVVGLRPIRTLIEGVRRVARGDHDVEPIPVRTHDELGVLAREFNEMAAALRRQRDALIGAERLAAIGEMAAQVAHEIRNPLNAIALNVELIEEGLSADDRGAVGPSLEAVAREVERLTDVTEAYLRFARLPRPRMESVDLAGLARDLVAFQSEEARRLEVSVQLRAPTSLEAMLDPDQVRQALLNLLRNAVEAAGPSGHVDVEVTRDPSGAHLRCVVADDGPGVAPEDTDRIFTPFFSNKKGGTGLGLAVAQRVAELHGGRLQVESLPDGRRGARFVLELPATRQ